MANDGERLGYLQDIITALGIPIVSMSVVNIDANPVVVNVTYGASATAEQIALAQQKIAEFDWRRRRALPRDTVVNTIGALTAGQRAIIDAHFRAENLRNAPRFASLLAQILGVPLVVDEVDPSP